MNPSIAWILLLTAGAAVAQTNGRPPSFEVASVKAAAPITTKEGREHVGLTVRGSRVEIIFTSLAELVRIAYRVKPYQVAGPDPTLSEHFDVLATLPDGANQNQVPEMLQTLLGERFKLTLHHESKQHAIYALTAGKNGQQLQSAEPSPDQPGPTWVKTGSAMRMTGTMTIAALSDFLGRFLDRPVTDATGLKGSYHIVLEIPLEDMIKAKTAAENAARGGSDSASDASDSPIFAAVQKLGLKLDSRKAPVDVLVIDHAEKLPTAN